MTSENSGKFRLQRSTIVYIAVFLAALSLFAWSFV